MTTLSMSGGSALPENRSAKGIVGIYADFVAFMERVHLVLQHIQMPREIVTVQLGQCGNQSE
jgi:hypothetical protein